MFGCKDEVVFSIIFLWLKKFKAHTHTCGCSGTERICELCVAEETSSTPLLLHFFSPLLSPPSFRSLHLVRKRARNSNGRAWKIKKDVSTGYYPQLMMQIWIISGLYFLFLLLFYGTCVLEKHLYSLSHLFLSSESSESFSQSHT